MHRIVAKNRTLYIGSLKECLKRLTRGATVETCISPGEWTPFRDEIPVYRLYLPGPGLTFYFEHLEDMRVDLTAENQRARFYDDDINPIDIESALASIKRLSPGETWSHDLASVTVKTMCRSEYETLVI